GGLAGRLQDVVHGDERLGRRQHLGRHGAADFLQGLRRLLALLEEHRLLDGTRAAEQHRRAGKYAAAAAAGGGRDGGEGTAGQATGDADAARGRRGDRLQLLALVVGRLIDVDGDDLLNLDLRLGPHFEGEADGRVRNGRGVVRQGAETDGAGVVG